MFHKRRIKALSLVVGLLAVAGVCPAQTMLNLKSQTRSADFSGAAYTKPAKTGSVLPALCSQGELFFHTLSAPGTNLYACVAANVWSALSSDVGPHTHPMTDLDGITGQQGSGSRIQMAGAGTPTADDCAKFDSVGNIVSAGQPCGNGGTGLPAFTVGLLASDGAAAQWRGVGLGLVLDNTTLSVDGSTIAQKGSPNTFTAANTFESDLAVNNAGKFDASGAAWTKPVKAGTAPPAGCYAGTEMFLDTDAGPGNQLLICNESGTGWTPAGSSAVAVAFGNASGLGDANAGGIAATAARSDHQHKRDVRVAVNGSDVGTRNRINLVAGANTTLSASDDIASDKVDVVVASSIPFGDASGLGDANAGGIAATAARSDHQHKRDVRVAVNGSDVGTRNRINLVAGANVTLAATDNVAADEVNVVVQAASGGLTQGVYQPASDDCTTDGCSFATSHLLPAGSLSVGKTIDVSSMGTMTTDATAPTPRMDIAWGSNPACTAGLIAFQPPSTTSGISVNSTRAWRLNAMFSLRATGTNGVLLGSGESMVQTSTSGTAVQLLRSAGNEGGATIDTTAAQYICIRQSASSGTAGDTYSLKQLVVRVF